MTTQVRVAHATTCRSDYGPAYWLIHELFHDSRIDPLLLVGGAHLSRRHGHTVDEIEKDGWPIAARIPFLGEDDAPSPAALAAALSGFGEALARLAPQLLVLYGDRIELLPIATAALLQSIPIAHVCGGDVTEGAIDDQVRHALTKLAHVHFPSNARSARRILQMGEEPWRVHDVGDPALDQFVRGDRADEAELTARLGFTPDRSTLLVTFHPTTVEPEHVATEAVELSAALAAQPGAIVITAPAPDPGSEVIRAELQRLAQTRPRTTFIESLGSRAYRGLLPLVGAMVGNSSSGIIEAPCVGLPVVNIGQRQAGRDRAANVIDVAAERQAIGDGIARALSPQFRASLAGITSPYGSGKGDASSAIVAALATLPPASKLLAKVFVLQ